MALKDKLKKFGNDADAANTKADPVVDEALQKVARSGYSAVIVLVVMALSSVASVIAYAKLFC
ncbi:MAG: hypothetical protein NTW90_06790 [Nitrosospira sp.]|nr:hypothetical protein [Nitrosospira sp.]